MVVDQEYQSISYVFAFQNAPAIFCQRAVSAGHNKFVYRLAVERDRKHTPRPVSPYQQSWRRTDQGRDDRNFLT